MLLHMAVRLLCRDNLGGMCFYLTAFADRFLVGSKESIMTPQGGRGGIREFAGSPPRTSGSAQIAWDILEKSPGDIRPEPTVGHFVVFEFPELHSRATFWMPGATVGHFLVFEFQNSIPGPHFTC